MSIRAAIDARLKELGWTRYKLAKMVSPHLSIQGVYQYMGGRNDIAGESLQRLLDVLNLELRPKSGPLVQKHCTKKSPRRKPLKKKALVKNRRKV